MGLHLTGSSLTGLSSAFVPRWQPSHAYVTGDIVMAPDGTIVQRNTDGTSGSSYTGTNWTVVAGGGGAVSSVAGKTGAVILSAADVGADPAGAAAAVVVPNELEVVVYSGSVGTTRPSAEFVVWQGYPTQPTNMADGDLWLSDTGGTVLNGSGAPTSGDGSNGDFWIRTSNSTLYGPKASGSWPSGVSLVGTNGTNGRGITSITRTSGTGAAGTTDTYTITYSDSTTSTFNVVNGADGAGASLTVQDEGSSLSTAATTINFVGSGVTATGTGAAKTVTIPGATSSNLTPTVQTTTYTAAANDLVLANATGGAFTVTLPTPTAGVRIGVKKTDSSTNAVTVATASGTIDGASTRTLPAQHAAQVYIADGTNWFRIDVPAVTAIAATGTASSTTYLRGDGSWSTPAGGTPTAPATDYTLPTGAIRATASRTAPYGGVAPTSGTVLVTGFSAYAGDVLSAANVRVITSTATGTHAWAVLMDSGRNVVAVSADNTSAAFTANTTVTFTFGSAYTVATSGLYYVGLCIVAGTVGAFLGILTTSAQSQLLGNPVLATSSTGQTTPPSVAATMGALTGQSSAPYFWLT